MAVHHVTQAHPSGQIIPGYNPATAPGIMIPKPLHHLLARSRGQFQGSARSLLARDILELRKIDAPATSLRQLIELNKQLYPGAYVK